MSTSDMGLRFSGFDKYSSKRQVSRELGINTIDGIWSNIVAYRANFSINLNLKSFDRAAYCLVQTPYITQTLAQFESKLNRIAMSYFQLVSQNQKDALTRISFNKCLISLAFKYNNLTADPNYFTRLILGNISAIDPKTIVFHNYLSCLRTIKGSLNDSFDVDYVAKLYSTITSNNELVQLYRSSELLDMNHRVLVNPDFHPASPSAIDSMMDELYEFVDASPLSATIKAIIACFHITETVPFDAFSEEIGLLVLKSIIAMSGIGEVISFADFETILKPTDELRDSIKEVNRTKDITYYIDAVIRSLSPKLDELLQNFELAKAESIEKEFYSKDSVNTDIFEEKIDEEFEVEETIEVVSESDDRVGEVEFVEQTNLETKIEIAIPSFRVGFNEQDAKLLERHLIESDPRLKTNEAKFFARHCTMGKFYSIRQFQNTMDTAYETARKSMDSLVSLGYYRKEAIKNKFVYTPIKKKGIE